MTSPTPRRLSKQALTEELLDPKTMTIRKRADYGTGTAENVGEIAVHATSDQLLAAAGEPGSSRGLSRINAAGIYR